MKTTVLYVRLLLYLRPPNALPLPN